MTVVVFLKVLSPPETETSEIIELLVMTAFHFFSERSHSELAVRGDSLRLYEVAMDMLGNTQLQTANRH